MIIDDLRRAGAQRVIAQEVRALHPEQATIDVAVLARTGSPSFENDVRSAGASVHYLAGVGLVAPTRVQALKQLVEAVKPDVVHTHLTYANVLGTLAAALARRPVVASLHNVDINQTKWPGPKRRIESFVLRRWSWRVAVVAESARAPTAANFGLPAERMVVVPNGIDAESIALSPDYDRGVKRQQLGALPGEYLVCNVGRLERSKGQQFLLQALAALRSHTPEIAVRLVLVGDGSEEHTLRMLAQRLDLDDRVAFVGVRSDVAEIIAASDLFVLPSLNEGLSQALLEAMALEAPVVATAVGGALDVLHHGRTGWVVPPAQPVALADAMRAALRERRAAMSRAARARALVAQHFGLKTHLTALRALYASVAAS